MSADAWSVCPRCTARRDVGLRGNDFREDYEIYGAETGTVTVSYHGECQRCGLKLVFESTHPIPDWQDPNQPTGDIQTRPWSSIPAGWFVKAPGGAWYEILKTRRVADAQVVTILVNGREGSFPYSADHRVVCRRGTRHTEVSDAVDLFGEGAEIREDELP